MRRQSNDDRSQRILAGRLEPLFRSNLAIACDFAAAALVAFMLQSSFPHSVLTAWLAVVLAIGAARYFYHRRCQRQAFHTIRSAQYFALGTLAAGLAWGALCAGLAVWGTRNDFQLMTYIAGAMTVCAAIGYSAYLPAYIAFADGFVLPLAAVSLIDANPAVAENGVQILLFLVVVSLAARYNSTVVNRSIELEVDNTLLQRSLTQTRIERDHAQVDKWSTMAQLSHELRTPLNAILGFSETMHQEFFGPLGTRYKEYASHIHESGRHLLKLTEELLDLSQGEAGRLQLRESAVDVGQLVLDLVQLMLPEAQKAGLSLAGEISATLPQLYGDETKVRQMLLNLVDNAIKFTPHGGQVAIGAGATSDGAIYLSVRDNGIGMEAEDIPVALLPLGRLETSLHRSTDGVGLGLPICKRLAELHAATLLVDSRPRIGTTFTIQFPPERSVIPAKAAVEAA